MSLIGDIGTRFRLPGWLGRIYGLVKAALLKAVAGVQRIGLPHLGTVLTDRLPKGLYPRSILIVVMPILILQAIVAYVFMERHWQMVTRRLSGAVIGDIAAIIEVIESYPQDERFSDITRIAAETYGLTISVLPPDPLPESGPRPFFSLLELDTVARDPPADQPTFLARHARQFRSRGDQDRPRRPRAQGLRAARPRLCIELPDLPVLDGRAPRSCC